MSIRTLPGGAARQPPCPLPAAGSLEPDERALLSRANVAFQVLLAVTERVDLLVPRLALPGRWSHECQV